MKIPGARFLTPVFALWVGLTCYYHLGGDGMELGGASISFNRGADFALYKINDKLALIAPRSGGLDVVTYDRGIPPFNLLCGTYDSTGTAMQYPRMSGDWLFGIPMEERQVGGEWRKVPVDGIAGVNLSTGELIRSKAVASFDVWPAELTARGLTDKTGTGPSLKVLSKRLKPLSVQQESCMVFNAAFLLIFLGWILFIPIVWLLSRKVAKA